MLFVPFFSKVLGSEERGRRSEAAGWVGRGRPDLERGARSLVKVRVGLALMPYWGDLEMTGQLGRIGQCNPLARRPPRFLAKPRNDRPTELLLYRRTTSRVEGDRAGWRQAGWIGRGRPDLERRARFPSTDSGQASWNLEMTACSTNQVVVLNSGPSFVGSDDLRPEARRNNREG